MGIIFFILGLCVGSFLNMAIFRLAKNYKLLSTKYKVLSTKRSYCDFCGRQLSWYENVPVVSWLIQKGKTRCCDNPLPWEYPIVEISTGVAFLLVFQMSDIRSQTIIYLVIAALLMFSLVFDLKYMILPDFATYTLIAISILLIIIKGGHIGPPVQYILSGLGALLFFFILNRIKIRGSEAMGMGDVKYSLFMGLFLGWPNIMVAIYFAFVVGAVVSITLLILRKVKKENPIPFGPFLILGTIVAKIFGDKLINYFFSVVLR